MAREKGEDDPIITHVSPSDSGMLFLESMPVAVYSCPYGRYSASFTASFPETRFSYRPVVLRALILEGRRASCQALIDSGSDRCLFPSLPLRKLGLHSAAMLLERASGVGASDMATHHVEVSIALHGIATFPARVGFAGGFVPLGFGPARESPFFRTVPRAL
jgi:hypothetical protein